MAKRQVTEDDLATGLKAFGGFPKFGSQPLRDNPFRDTREPVTPPPPVSTKPIESSKPEPELKVRVSEKPLAKEVTKSVVTIPVATSEPIVEAKKVVIIKPDTDLESAPKVISQAAKSPAILPQQSPRNEVSYERVTLPMTAEMREGFERMARELQRKRSQKNERITANTVMRVALEFFMDRFSVEKTDRVNTEEELLEAAKQQLGGE